MFKKQKNISKVTGAKGAEEEINFEQKMAMSVVSSKYALLPDDDEDYNKKALRNRLHEKSNESEAKNQPSSKPKPKKNKKKKNSQQNNDQNSNSNRKNDAAKDEQFVKWIEKDQQVNDEAFAQELQSAILASKLEFNQKNTQEKQQNPEKSKKSKNTLSLQEFNAGYQKTPEKKAVEEESLTSKDKFFEDVEEATKKALNREQIRESLLQRFNVS